jgi:predicted ATP-dependent endonuclease of OLD family
VTLKEDYTKWKDRDKDSDPKFIQFDVDLQIKRDDDEGLHRFLQDYLQLPATTAGISEKLNLKLMIRYRGEPSSTEVAVQVSDQILEALKSQEVLKKIQSSFAVLFHDSTEFFHPYRFLESTGMFQEMSDEEAAKITQAKVGLDKALTKIAKRNQQDLTQVLGRLKDKYKIGLSVDRTDTSQVPYNITLGTEDLNVELEKWGSGTQNRTRILMTLFKAKRVRESATSPAKITPVIVIEEPESYLHPSAQAEFGSILRDLANEFQV